MYNQTQQLSHLLENTAFHAFPTLLHIICNKTATTLGSSEPIGLGADLPFLQPSASHQLILQVHLLGVGESRDRVSYGRSAELLLVFADPWRDG